MQTVEESVQQYAAAWNVVGVENIKAALEKCWTAESTYVDPQNGPVKGFDGLAELINGSYADMPGRVLRNVTSADFHNHSGRFLWDLTLANGDVIDGQDYFEYNEQNQVTRIVGFFGPQVKPGK